MSIRARRRLYTLQYIRRAVGHSHAPSAALQMLQHATSKERGTVTKQCERRPTLRAYLYHHEIAQHQCYYCENLERVLPCAARISVLGIPRRGWRGFESPAKFKLLAMGRRPLSVALGVGKVKRKKALLLDVAFCCSIGPGFG